MQPRFLARPSLAFLAGMGLLLLPAAGRSANQNPVKFETFDGVELHGTFYPGGADSACVLFVHNIGSSRDKGGWEALATALQAKNYAVLSFDLRGHGESQNLSAPERFWRVAANVQFIRGANPRRTQISFKEFDRQYYPMLANDLAAAKFYLDQQSNARLCNSANLMVVGAEEGADLGALWIYSEWGRRRFVQDAFGRMVPGGPPEAEDIAAAVWLTIEPSFAGVNAGTWLRPPANPGGAAPKLIPMAFIYGKEDSRAAKTASTFEAELQRVKKDPLTAARAKAGKLAGAALLGKESLGTEQDIVNYITAVMEKRGASAAVQRNLPQLPYPAYAVPLAQLGFNWLR